MLFLQSVPTHGTRHPLFHVTKIEYTNLIYHIEVYPKTFVARKGFLETSMVKLINGLPKSLCGIKLSRSLHVLT
jgi:hypothetical protein